MNKWNKGRTYDLVRAKREPDVRADETVRAPHKGWYTRGYLPHCDKPGLIQFISYRLNDAMPVAKRHEWEELLRIDDEQERITRIENYVDRGFGACHLRDSRVATLIEENWLRFDAERYRLIAWVIMPNHVHLLIEQWTTALPTILKSWKAFTSAKANQMLGTGGRFWQAEFFDRYIRDEEHFCKALRYIEGNPVCAKLVRTPAAWPFSSANPKWQWTDATATGRYSGARLAHECWDRFEKREGARTVTSARCNTDIRADVTVRAPDFL